MRKPVMAMIAGILVVGTSGPALAHHAGIRGVSAEFQGICLTQHADPSLAILDGEVFIEESRRDVRRFRVTWKLHARPRDGSGDWTVVEGLDIDDFSRGRIDASTAELAEERDAVTELGLI